MIGFLTGEIIFSDGTEAILLTKSGVGHQVFFNEILREGETSSIYISHIIRDSSQTLFGFKTLRSKKVFELLTTVKGVGPKSAYALVSYLGVDQIIEAIMFDSKKTLTKVPGVGPKAAAQMVLDLSDKIKKVKMYTDNWEKTDSDDNVSGHKAETIKVGSQFVDDAIMACKELGFKEDIIIPIINRVLDENEISKPEQLIHLVLKEV